MNRRELFEKHRWVTFVVPLAAFMLVGLLEPKPSDSGSADSWLAIPYRAYPIVYTVKIILTVVAVLFVLPGYREFPLRLSLLALLVGLVGAGVWIGFCAFQLEQKLSGIPGFGWLVAHGARSAFNPFEELRDYPAAYTWGFLAVRFFGLVAVITVVEEFFLRGFLMRFVMQAKWWEVPFGKVNALAAVAGTLVPMLMHPGELFAAAVWFSLVTWLMLRTKNIWDCVAAHAITNLLLGIYVVWSDQWHLV